MAGGSKQELDSTPVGFAQGCDNMSHEVGGTLG